MKHFNVITFGYIKMWTTIDENVMYYLPVKKIIDAIERADVAVGDGGRGRLKNW